MHDQLFCRPEKLEDPHRQIGRESRERREGLESDAVEMDEPAGSAADRNGPRDLRAHRAHRRV